MFSRSLGSISAANEQLRLIMQQRQEQIDRDNDDHHHRLLVNGGNGKNEGIKETVAQKRKRLFNRNTGSLQLDLRNTPFWIWNEWTHERMRELTNSKCCFVDMIGRPVNPKTGEECPLYPYEHEIMKCLFVPEYENHNNDPRRWKHLWIKKARGAGVTEFMVYLMIYLPCKYPEVYYDSQMAIITGVNQKTANRVMERIKHKLYNKLRLTFDFNDRIIDINGCLIETFPARRPDSYRGLHNVKMTFNDEADFYDRSIIEDVMDSNEGYWGKSNPFTIFNSTANEPDGLMERIEKQDLDHCNYKRLFILADRLRGYIYTDHDLDIASISPSYAREYLGEYKGEKGNLFPIELLNYAAGLTDVLELKNTVTGAVVRTIYRPEYELTVQEVVNDPRYLGVGYYSSIGVDPAFNSSMFASVVNKEIGGLVYAVYESEQLAPSFEEGIELVKRLMYQDYPCYHPKIWIDASSVPFIRALKKEIGENSDYHSYTQEQLLQSMNSPRGMVVCPVAFSKFGDRMNYNLRRLMELGKYRIDRNVTPHLWASMNSAKFDEIRNRFDKNATSYNDVYDSARLAAINFKIGGTSILY